MQKIYNVVAAFQKSTFEYDKEKVKNGNEDDVESYMCCWENELRKKD